MAKSLNKGIDSTLDAPGVTLPIAGIKFGLTHRVKSESPAEAVLVNITSPLDRMETVRLGYTEVADVYKNTSIYDSVRGPSKQGVQILGQLSEVWTLSDSVDATYRVDLPVKGHLVLTVPACEYITQNDILAFVGRVISTLYDGETGDWRIADLLRGALVPKDL